MLNIDGAPLAFRSHTHPSPTQNSRLRTSSLSLGDPVLRATSPYETHTFISVQSVFLVFHHTDTHIYVSFFLNIYDKASNLCKVSWAPRRRMRSTWISPNNSGKSRQSFLSDSTRAVRPRATRGKSMQSIQSYSGTVLLKSNLSDRGCQGQRMARILSLLPRPRDLFYHPV